MGKKPHFVLVTVFLLSSSIIFGISNQFSFPGTNNSDSSVNLSDSDSWAKIVKKGYLFEPNMEVYNDSVYSFCVFNEDFLYVSKFTTSGVKEWEFSMKLTDRAYYSYDFDSQGNLYFGFHLYDSNGIQLIKFNSTGALIISKNYYFEGESYSPRLVLGINNSVFIVHRSTIFNLGSMGELLWNFSLNVDWLSRVMTDEINNFYFTYSNNSEYGIAKANSSGELIWSLELEEGYKTFFINEDAIFVMDSEWGTYTNSVQKISTNGSLIKQINFPQYYIYKSVWCEGNIFLFDEYSNILCYYSNLTLKWIFSPFPNNSSYYRRTFITQDSDENYKILLKNPRNILYMKINKTGDFISSLVWGGGEVYELINTDVDSECNIYFLSNCMNYDAWGSNYFYIVLVKNPQSGGEPPVPVRNLGRRDYILFSALVIGIITSIASLITILRSRKKRP